MSVFGMIASAIGGSLAGSLGNSVTNSISQAQQFEYNKTLQERSFQHDKEMLDAQVRTSEELAKRQLNLKYNMLRAGGYTATDAARGALGAPTTRVLDWSGTRNYAPEAAKTSSFSGGFLPSYNLSKNTKPISRAKQNSRPASLASSTSWGQPQASLSTGSTGLSSLSSRPSPSSGPGSRRPSLPQSWYTGSSRSLSPFAPGALQLTYTSSRSSSSSGTSAASTVDERLLSSWKPFNLRNQPGFTRFHPRGSSTA